MKSRGNSNTKRNQLLYFISLLLSFFFMHPVIGNMFKQTFFNIPYVTFKRTDNKKNSRQHDICTNCRSFKYTHDSNHSTSFFKSPASFFLSSEISFENIADDKAIFIFSYRLVKHIDPDNKAVLNGIETCSLEFFTIVKAHLLAITIPIIPRIPIAPAIKGIDNLGISLVILYTLLIDPNKKYETSIADTATTIVATII